MKKVIVLFCLILAAIVAKAQKKDLALGEPALSMEMRIMPKYYGKDGVIIPPPNFTFNNGLRSSYLYCKYSGDIVGGIICLLSNDQQCISSNIFFLNQPKEREFTTFYYRGSFLSTNQKANRHVNAQEIILNMLQEEYQFEVTTAYDSIDYIYLNVIDRKTLNKHCIGISINGYSDFRRDSTHVFYTKFKLEALAFYIADQANIRLEPNPEFAEIGGSLLFGVYNFDFPLDMFDAPLIWLKFDEINQFLATKGLRLERRRKLEKVYNIRFLDGR